MKQIVFEVRANFTAIVVYGIWPLNDDLCSQLENRRLRVVSPALAHPRTGKTISVSVAIALRACERAKLRALDDSSVARARHTNLWGPSSSSSGRRSQLEVRAFSILTDDL